MNVTIQLGRLAAYLRGLGYQPYVSGSPVFIATWNATTNIPALASGVGPSQGAGGYYLVSVAGSTSLDGISTWSVGDWAIWNGTAWQKVNGSASETFNGVTTGTLTVTGATAINPANANVSIAPTGTGVLTIGSGAAGSMNNVAIGGTTPLAGAFTTLNATGLIVSGSGTTTAVGIQVGYSGTSGTAGLWVTGVTPSNANAFMTVGPAVATQIFSPAGQNIALRPGSAIQVYSGVTPDSDATRSLGAAGNRFLNTNCYTYSTGAPVTQTGASYTVLTTDACVIINNVGGSHTLTLPSPATFTGRSLIVKATGTTTTVVSATANVVPLAGTAAATAILSGAGKWAYMKSDGTSWIVMMAN